MALDNPGDIRDREGRSLHSIWIRVGSLLAVLTLLAAACDNGDDGGGSAEGSGDAPASADGACDDSDPVRMGTSLALTGPAAPLGTEYQAGVELAVEHANAGELITAPGDFGILGRCIELIVKDDEGDPTRAAQVVRELLFEDEVHLLAGPTLSATVGPTLDVVQESQIVQTVIAGTPEAGNDPESYPYTFQPVTDTITGARTWVDYAEALGAERPAILAPNAAHGTANVEAVEEQGELDPVIVEFHEPGQTDMTPHLQAIQEADADFIVMISVGGGAIAALNARAELGMMDVPVVSYASVSAGGVVDAVGVENMEDVFAGWLVRNCSRAPGEDAPVDEQCAALHSSLKESLGQDPLEIDLQQAALGYDIVTTLIAGAAGAESLEGDAVSEWLETNCFEAIQKDEVCFSATSHQTLTPADITFGPADSRQDGVIQQAEVAQG